LLLRIIDKHPDFAKGDVLVEARPAYALANGKRIAGVSLLVAGIELG
jgi:hypothetical protein